MALRVAYIKTGGHSERRFAYYCIILFDIFWNQAAQMQMKTALALTIAFFFAFTSWAALAERLPLWEIGLGGVLMDGPDYRGADEHTVFLVPTPYVTYRGERLRIGRKGIQGLLFDTETASLDISLFGTPPVDSDGNGARRGMEDLDPTLEIGPSLELLLYKSANEKTLIELNLPLRAVFATDLSYLNQKGWTFFPHIDLLRQHPPHGRMWRFELSLGPLFGSGDYHQYYFGVDSADALPQRPAYDAPRGYSGMRFIMNYRRYLSDDLIFWFFAQHENLRHSAIEESPLVRDRTTLLVGTMLVWVFSHSGTLVEDGF